MWEPVLAPRSLSRSIARLLAVRLAKLACAEAFAAFGMRSGRSGGCGRAPLLTSAGCSLGSCSFDRAVEGDRDILCTRTWPVSGLLETAAACIANAAPDTEVTQPARNRANLQCGARRTRAYIGMYGSALDMQKPRSAPLSPSAHRHAHACSRPPMSAHAVRRAAIFRRRGCCRGTRRQCRRRRTR